MNLVPAHSDSSRIIDTCVLINLPSHTAVRLLTYCLLLILSTTFIGEIIPFITFSLLSSFVFINNAASYSCSYFAF